MPSPHTLLVLTISALVILLIIAGCTQNPPTHLPVSAAPTPHLQQGHYTPNETLVAFVQEAAAYAKSKGKEQALLEFTNPNGSFIRGELYIYAYDFNGTTLAHPVNPEKIGKKRDDEGAIGVFVREMGASVRNGSGYYRFTYVNPARNRTLESKLGFGMKVDETWWLGSGIYTGPVITPAQTTTSLARQAA